MALSERARDWLVTSAFAVVIGGLVVTGWLTRERTETVTPGDAMPALSLPLIDGGMAALDEYRGRVVLLNVWATWCLPCVRELPSMQRAYEKYAADGLEILAVAVDADPGEPDADGRIEGVVSEFARRYGLTFPVAVDPTGGTERRLGVDYLPTTLIIGRDGRLLAREVGARDWDEGAGAALIERLLSEG